jgi:hypothetical protein
MRRMIFVFCALMCASSVRGAEKVFDFGEQSAGQVPKDFHPVSVGRGRPGDWKVVLEDITPTITPLTDKAPSVTKRPVLAQLSRDAVTNRFPLLIYDGETFGSVKFTARFKLVGGGLEQCAGLVFRYQNESNFFLVIARSLEGKFQCTKVVNNQMLPPYQAEVEIAKDNWHDITVQCEGTRINCLLDGNTALKLVDNSASGIVGKIGFCTKSDAVSYFSDAKATFTPREIFAQKLVNGALAEYSRLINLKIYATRRGEKAPEVIAGKNPNEIGLAGTTAEQDVIKTGHSYFGKGKETATVILPLRDRNGEPMAAVSVEMKTFRGQTEDNALVRAQPIIRKIQGQANSLDELLE